jgi:RNA polymerase sigma factor (sigma-70 family)
MRNESGPEERTAQDVEIGSAIARARGRLRSFIQRRVHDPLDAEDILQDVFYELVLAYRLMKPIEEAGAWMFSVARNRIIDLVRRKKAVSLDQTVSGAEDGSTLRLEHLLPSPGAGPDAEYARGLLIAELEHSAADHDCHRGIRASGAPALELADARAVRLASPSVLASGRSDGTELDLVRGSSRIRDDFGSGTVQHL